MTKYLKNCILIGDIEYYCLLCKEIFYSTTDLEKHIRWEQHRIILKEQDYLPKFKTDYIYKIDETYFCGLCEDIVEPLSLSKHIKSEGHRNNKNNPKDLKRDSIAKFVSDKIHIGDTIIDKYQWHGVSGRDCKTCDELIFGYDKHLNSLHHMKNLIKTEFKVGELPNQYYRKVNDEKLYCFLCKKVFPPSCLKSHWEGSGHKYNDKKKSKSVPDNESNEEADILDNNLLDFEIKLTDSDLESLKIHYNFDVNNNKSECKLCKESIEVNFKALYNHLKQHDIVIYSKLIDHGKRRSELAKYGNKIFIELSEGGRKGYCKVCNTYLSPHINIFTSHAEGARHKGILQLRVLTDPIKNINKPKYKTIQFKDYLKYMHYEKEIEGFWIDKGFWLDVLSCVLISRLEHKQKCFCYACDMIISLDANHFTSKTHQELLMSSKIITLFEKEFVREIRPNLYHCGVCNEIYPYWNLLEKHLKSLKHGVKYMSCCTSEDWFRRKIASKLSSKDKNLTELLNHFI